MDKMGDGWRLRRYFPIRKGVISVLVQAPADGHQGFVVFVLDFEVVDPDGDF